MKEYNCKCGWRWIVGKNKVYGPIWPDYPFAVSAARMHKRNDWNEGYGDCARGLR